MGIFGLSITLGSSASLGTLKMADVLSSQTWKESVNGEIKGRKAWQEKYGHQFEDDGVTPVSSRPSTGRASACSRPPSTRSQSNMSQCSDDSQARKVRCEMALVLCDRPSVHNCPTASFSCTH